MTEFPTAGHDRAEKGCPHHPFVRGVDHTTIDLHTYEYNCKEIDEGVHLL